MPPEVEDQVEEVTEQLLEEAVENNEEIEESEEVVTPVNNQAQALFDLLNNKATAKSTVQMIASNLGLTLSEAKSEEGQKAISDVIKEALGEDMAFLGDKLGPLGNAIEKLIGTRISEVENKIQKQFKDQEAVRFTADSQVAMTKIDVETKGEFNNLLPKINKLMDEIPLGPNTNPETYLRRLYTIAKNEAPVKKESTPERTEKARRESQNNTIQGSQNASRTKNGSSKLPSIREAVLAAARGEKLEN